MTRDLAAALQVNFEWLGAGEGEIASVPGDESGTGRRDLDDLLEALRPDAALEDLVQLPPGYLQRYRERAKEIEGRLGQHAVIALARAEIPGFGQRPLTYDDFLRYSRARGSTWTYDRVHSTST